MRFGLAAAVVGTALLPPLVLGLARWSPSLGSLAGYDWRNRPGTPAGLLDALGSVLGMVRAVNPRYGYAVPVQSGQWLLTAVVVLAVAALVTARATAWLAVVWTLLVVASVATIAPVAAVLTPAGAAALRSLTLFFYNAPFRMGAVVAVVSAVVLGVGAARVSGLLRAPLRPVAGVAGLVVLAVVAAGSVERASVRLAAGYAPRTTGPDQLAVMDQLAALLRTDPLPAGAAVANEPVDGSAWLYALHGVPVLFRHHSAGPVTPDGRLLLDRLDEVDDDAAVQQALRDLRICYVYASDVPVEDSQPLATGFTDLDGARLLQPVARSGGAAAYRVLVPGTPCAPSS